MANVKTYKMEPETSEKLQKICEELHLTWDGTFQTLANLYAQQKAVGKLPERGMEVKEFQSLLNRVSEAFTYALTVNADAEDRIRQEFAQKFAAQQQALQETKAQAEDETKARKAAELQTREAQGQADSYRQQLEKVTRDLDHVQENARLAAKSQAEALADKERLNHLQAQQLKSLTDEKEKWQAAAKKTAELEAEGDRLRRELEAAQQAVKLARAENEKLQSSLREKEQVLKARTDALEEQYLHEKRMLMAKAENERQSAVLQVKSEYAARLESLQEKYMAQLEKSYAHANEKQDSEKNAAKAEQPAQEAGKTNE
ncbi:MAG: M protein repeat protein [Mitsuokella multacida]|jgi:DNA repair exonuclease SbcCD ATPase subunit